MENTEYAFEDYPLGVTEIAQVLGVKKATVSQWLQRNILPKPDASVNGGRTKIWKTKNIIDWANATGRNKAQVDSQNVKSHINTGHYWRYDTYTKEAWDNWTRGKGTKSRSGSEEYTKKKRDELDKYKEKLESQWDSLGKFAESEEE